MAGEFFIPDAPPGYDEISGYNKTPPPPYQQILPAPPPPQPVRHVPRPAFPVPQQGQTLYIIPHEYDYLFDDYMIPNLLKQKIYMSLREKLNRLSQEELRSDVRRLIDQYGSPPAKKTKPKKKVSKKKTKPKKKTSSTKRKLAQKK